ncbi:metal-dependent hydrolase [Halogeometricum sp. S1BR25-6]|uniref:Metal-dependent hydrolase n=1 Tax=Halogeometricum salsisoli TaxID=2950536 RepID=A0ABU2GIT1_9EURY|nr:metal-dependent hydrolase [Halogeometricum sp. S1BR25-6]MDS0300715.1 metal-dependent hydrolase [Halogeometricum sp. S1BR25-6]
MYFVTHLAVGALLGRWSRLPVPWVVAGTALPDVVDKPLAMLGVVDLYHTVGHTALLAPLAVVAALLSSAGRALAVGWASHLFLDAFHIVLNGRYGDALFLGWPVVVPPDPLALPPGAFFFYYLWSPSFFLECAFWTGLGVVLLRNARADRPSGETRD